MADKEIKMLKYALAQTFDGAMLTAAEDYVDDMVDDLQMFEEQNARLKAELKEKDAQLADLTQVDYRKCLKQARRRHKQLIRVFNAYLAGKMVDADGIPYEHGAIYVGEDGREWEFIRPRDLKYGLFQEAGSAEKDKRQPIRYEWLSRIQDAEG